MDMRICAMAETWILYQTTNLLNFKIYVGVHKVADTPRSRQYLGSGDKITAAIKKYGRKNFERITLAEFSCLEDAYSAEANLVNKEFVNRKDTYNVCLGGRGGVNFTEEMKVKLSMAKKGKPRSDATKAKISAFNRGKITPETTKEKMRTAATEKSLAVVVNGIYYPSSQIAGRKEGMLQGTLLYRAKSTSPKFINYRLATEEEKSTYTSNALE
jgi:hypothetical protein